MTGEADVTNGKVLLEIHEKMGELRGDMKHVISKLEKSEERSETRERAMWRKIDSHSKWINGMKAIVGVFVLIFGTIIVWFKHKLGVH